jgi:hypothetical protein
MSDTSNKLVSEEKTILGCKLLMDDSIAVAIVARERLCPEAIGMKEAYLRASRGVHCKHK